MVRAIQSRKLEIDFGLVVEFTVPEDMSDDKTLLHIYEATGGKGDPRKGYHMDADLAWHVGHKLSGNLKATGVKIAATGGSQLHLSVKGDDGETGLTTTIATSEDD